ncbi:Extracellular calcium-sensing receptor [Trichoplax sp. H2]|nr:Extracellular calcium-sensing receptor [Trichoplax sp. H2]|eukprot:RDD46659.1 Extracellular calcium-sensing receptor [Trichoplax sp. H2]
MNVVRVWRFWQFYLLILSPTVWTHWAQNLNNSTQIMLARDHGDIVLGGLFAAHFEYNPLDRKCAHTSERGIKHIQAMIYAIQQINNNNHILPNIKLGYYIRDSCNSPNYALEEALDFIISTYNTNNGVQRSLLLSNFCHSQQASSSSTTDNNQNRLPNIFGIVGGRASRVSIPVASLVSNFDIAMISYASTSRLLSDKAQFGSFFRTVPSDEFQAAAMVDIIKHFNWTYVATVATDDSYGRLAISTFKNISAHDGICIAVEEYFPILNNQQKITEIIQRLRRYSDAVVIVMYCAIYEATLVLREAEKQNLTGRIFIGSEAWSDSPNLVDFRQDVIGGMLSVVLTGRETQVFRQYLDQLDLCNNLINPWFKQMWISKAIQRGYNIDHLLSNCSIPTDLSGNKTDRFYDSSTVTAYVIDAVYAFAYALHDMYQCDHHHCQFSNHQFDRKKFLSYLHNVSFSALSNPDFSFNSNGDVVARYIIKNLQKDKQSGHLKFTSIGEWIGYGDKEDRLIINETLIRWQGNRNWTNIPASSCSRDCNPGTYRKMYHQHLCCWKCLPCETGQYSNSTNADSCLHCTNGFQPNPKRSACVEILPELLEITDPLTISITVTMMVFLIIVALVWSLFIKHRQSSIVKASNYLLSHILLFAITVCFLIPPQFLIQPTNTICNSIFISFSLAVSLVLATLLAKTNQIKQIFFRHSMTKVRKQSYLMKNSGQVIFIIALVSIEAIICCIAVLQNEIHVRRVVFDSRIYLICDSTHHLGLAVAMGYIGILMITITYLAFKTRNLPENFCEARYLCFTAVVLTCILASLVPTYVITPGHYRVGVATFGTMSFAASVLIAFYMPKVYIILHKPEMNSRQKTMQDITNFTFTVSNLTEGRRE